MKTDTSDEEVDADSFFESGYFDDNNLFFMSSIKVTKESNMLINGG